MENRSFRIPKADYGFTLGGGGAKAFSQLGAIKALEEKGIRPSYFSGSSMGFVNAVLLSAGYSVEELFAFYREHKATDFFSLAFFSASNRKLGKIVLDLCEKKGYRNLEELPRPVYASVTVFHTGQEIILRRGRIDEAVMSSTAAFMIRKHRVMDIQIRKAVQEQSHGLFGKKRKLYLADSCYSANVPFELLPVLRKDLGKSEKDPYFDFIFDVVPKFHPTGFLPLDDFNRKILVQDQNRKIFFEAEGRGLYFSLEFGIGQTSFNEKALNKGYSGAKKQIEEFLSDCEIA